MTTSPDTWSCQKCFCSNSTSSGNCWNCHTRRVVAEGATTLPQQGSLRSLLQNYVGRPVQINFRDRQRAESARLTQIQGDYFSVSALDSGEHYHFPLRYLVSARESTGSATDSSAELVLEVHRAPPDGDRADA
jgi:hypothetical protein